jgi:hypothetical protein
MRCCAALVSTAASSSTSTLTIMVRTYSRRSAAWALRGSSRSESTCPIGPAGRSAGSKCATRTRRRRQGSSTARFDRRFRRSPPCNVMHLSGVYYPAAHWVCLGKRDSCKYGMTSDAGGPQDGQHHPSDHHYPGYYSCGRWLVRPRTLVLDTSTCVRFYGALHVVPTAPSGHGTRPAHHS